MGWLSLAVSNRRTGQCAAEFYRTPISWLGSTTWAMPVLILLSIWKQLGFNMVFLAGLQAIPPVVKRQLDGLMPGSSFGILLTWITSYPRLCNDHDCHFTLRSFEQVYVITGGGPLNSTNLLVYYIYEQAFAQFDFGYAAAAATVLLAIALLLYIFSCELGARKLGVVTFNFFSRHCYSNTNHANLPELSSEATVSVTAS